MPRQHRQRAQVTLISMYSSQSVRVCLYTPRSLGKNGALLLYDAPYSRSSTCLKTFIVQTHLDTSRVTSMKAGRAQKNTVCDA